MTQPVQPKKSLGQHFLRDENIARKIADSLSLHGDYKYVVEVGPGMGMLTKYLLERSEFETGVVEIDRDSVAYLKENYPTLEPRIIEGDFMKVRLDGIPAPFAVIGNFPYNVSSQILFRVLELRNSVPEVVGMFQKEVARRIATPPGSKEYGILSVLLQAYYTIEYLFTVNENVFFPPPKVKSAVIRLKRNQVMALDCNEKLFFQVVKTAFNQRRKTLRNALLSMVSGKDVLQEPIFEKRAEQLQVSDFVWITRHVEQMNLIIEA
ncbi:MAG: 16S rRNA (adenine(1518)-N(6)/adenine(1519)-N(6))-dimethyltransferase RsmA [Bacteroidota bacterium]